MSFCKTINTSKTPEGKPTHMKNVLLFRFPLRGPIFLDVRLVVVCVCIRFVTVAGLRLGPPVLLLVLMDAGTSNKVVQRAKIIIKGLYVVVHSANTFAEVHQQFILRLVALPPVPVGQSR